MYPSNGYEFYEQFRDQDGNVLSFKTINMVKDWQTIKGDLAEVFPDP